MTTIGIDARLYSQTGVGVYIRNFLHHLSAVKPDDTRYMVYVLDEEKLEPLPDFFTVRRTPHRWHTVGEQLGFCRALLADNLDLMHFTYFSYPILYSRRFVCTIHDMILLQHKTGKASTRGRLHYEVKHMVFSKVFSSQVKKAVAIITPTNTVKDQLITTFGQGHAPKIHTIYEGLDFRLAEAKPDMSLNKKYKKPFFMYVGNFYPHKNVERLIKAMARVEAGYDLVLIGPDDHFSNSIRRLVEQENMAGRVHMRHNASVEKLAYYYMHANALVHPSLSEGFGLPLVEAAHFNLPVIASDIPVFRELLGEQYTAFDPYDSASIARRINEHIARPFKPAYGDIRKKCSFSQMTRDIVALYNSLT